LAKLPTSRNQKAFLAAFHSRGGRNPTFAETSGERPARPASDNWRQESASLLLGDDLVLDLVINALWQDILLHQVVFSLVGAAFDNGVGARGSDARQGVEISGTRGIDVEQAAAGFSGLPRWSRGPRHGGGAAAGADG